MNQKSQPLYFAWRFYLVLSLLTLAVLGLGFRIFDLAVLNQHFLRYQGDERALRMVSAPAFRGMIVDRNGYPLAVSTPVASVWINPQEFDEPKKAVQQLAKILQMKASDITALVNKDKKRHREFAYLKRGLSPEVARQVKAIGMTGVYTQSESKRFYPEGEVAAHLIGFTNVDDQGQEGLELGYNKWLQGEPGKKWVTKDRLGRVISDVQNIQDQKPGHDLVLSMDRRVQYLAYRELMAGILENQAKSGTAIVLDAKTGEVLAMANYPSFNPNNRPSQMNDVFRNRAVTDTFEPGSTIKAFSVASAIDSGKYKASTQIDTNPGWMRVGRNVVIDHKNEGLLTLEQVLQLSSNVGVTKIILTLPPDQLWNVLHRVGFGEATGIGFPGEQSGALVRHQPWGSFTLATLAFGYGVSVTTLQLARAYDVIANDGIKLPVSLLKLDEQPKGERVMNPKVAEQMRLLLESVVTKGGTGGELARVPGYRVGGKTGTAKMVGAHGYERHRYMSSFVGMAPLTNPRLVVAVVIQDPQGKHYYGGQVSGPVFSRIMAGTLRILDVAPDQA